MIRAKKFRLLAQHNISELGFSNFAINSTVHHTNSHIDHLVSLEEHLFYSPTAYLSEVDVNSVLQELRGLPGPLLNGQHPDRFHTGLQLDHSCILILRERRGRVGGGGETLH